jgi:GNAT superfamily N-acetyltransferase
MTERNSQLSEQFILRAGTTDDFVEMAMVIDRASAHRAGEQLPDHPTKASINEVIEHAIATEPWLHIMQHADGIAGFAMGHPVQQPIAPRDDTVEYLALLMTDPDHWGKGIGSRLLEAVAATAQDRQREQLMLWTAGTNQRARELYERHGYSLTGRKRVSKNQGTLVQYIISLA